MTALLGAFAGFVLVVALIAGLNAIGGVPLVIAVGVVVCVACEWGTRRLRRGRGE